MAQEPPKRMTLQCDGCVYRGTVLDGERHGRGRLTFLDEGEDEHDELVGTFKNGVLHGRAIYHHADGRQTVGTYTDGTLNGVVRELDESGELLFIGMYQDGVRNGYGTLVFGDGGTLTGPFVDGTMDCKEAVEGNRCSTVLGAEEIIRLVYGKGYDTLGRSQGDPPSPVTARTAQAVAVYTYPRHYGPCVVSENGALRLYDDHNPRADGCWDLEQLVGTWTNGECEDATYRVFRLSRHHQARVGRNRKKK